MYISVKLSNNASTLKKHIINRLKKNDWKKKYRFILAKLSQADCVLAMYKNEWWIFTLMRVYVVC